MERRERPILRDIQVPDCRHNVNHPEIQFLHRPSSKDSSLIVHDCGTAKIGVTEPCLRILKSPYTLSNHGIEDAALNVTFHRRFLEPQHVTCQCRLTGTFSAVKDGKVIPIVLA